MKGIAPCAILLVVLTATARFLATTAFKVVSLSSFRSAERTPVSDFWSRRRSHSLKLAHRPSELDDADTDGTRFKTLEGLVEQQRLELMMRETEFAVLQAKRNAERNGRASLEQLIVEWFRNRNNIPPGKKVSTNQAFKAFAGLRYSTDPRDSDDKKRFNDALDDVVQDGKEFGITHDSVHSKFMRLGNIMSAAAHRMDESLLNGYTVNHNADFSGAASLKYRFFNITHTVLSPGYMDTCYTWDAKNKTRFASKTCKKLQ